MVRSDIRIRVLNVKTFILNRLRYEEEKYRQIKKEEAMAWVIKYLIVASTELNFILLIRRGAIPIKLISRPIQAENQEEAEIVIKVPKIKEGKKISCLRFIIIKKKNKFYKWGMNPVALLSLSFCLVYLLTV